MSLPRYFCWTRYGTEAGESIQTILRRKEVERTKNGGVFLWGVGNAIGPSVRVLLEKTSSPKVAFSPMKSRPKKVDVSPEATIAWRKGESLDGEVQDLPPFSLVTSRVSTRSHYALVCYTENALWPQDDEVELSFGALTNLASGRKIGASQVTSVVRRDDRIRAGSTYTVTLVADLHPPYFVRLRDGLPVEQLRLAG